MEILRMDANQSSSSVLPHGGGLTPIDPADTVFLALNHHLLHVAFLLISFLFGLLVCRIYSHRARALCPCSPDPARSRLARGLFRSEDRVFRNPAFARWFRTLQSTTNYVSGSLSDSTFLAVLKASIDFGESFYVTVRRIGQPRIRALSTLTAASIQPPKATRWFSIPLRCEVLVAVTVTHRDSRALKM
jgi:hypothetical protein